MIKIGSFLGLNIVFRGQSLAKGSFYNLKWFLCLSLPWVSSCGLSNLKDKALDALVNKIPLEMEEAIGDGLLPQILPKERAFTDKKTLQQLEELLLPLIKSSGLDKDFVKVHISKDSELNAFAAPGGHLIFNAGMLRAAERSEEILGVAAHELAHAKRRHVTKSMVQSVGLSVMVGVVFGDLEGVAAFLIQQGQAMLSNGFSRTQESEADELGFRYLVVAGIDPRGMADFFQRIQKKNEDSPLSSSGALGKVASFLSTHPLTEERIKLLHKRYDGLSGERKDRIKPVEFPLKSFQDNLGKSESL